MPNLYAIQFEILPEPQSKAACVFDALHNEVAAWVIEKYKKRWSTDCIFPRSGEILNPLPDHSLQATIANTADGVLERVRWMHPDDYDPHLLWTTDVAIARGGERLQFAAQVGIASIDYVVRPTRLSLGRPRIVTQILEQHPCWAGPQPLLTRKQEIQAGDIPAFVEDLLLNEKRSIPIVVISHDRFSDRPLVDPDRMQQCLMGFAQVVVINKWAGFRLTDCLGKPLSCFNGCVRVYWPALTRESNPLQHWLYFPAQLERFECQHKPLEKRLFNFLAEVSSFRFTDGEIAREIQIHLDQERKAEIARVRQQIEDGRAAAKNLQEAQEWLDFALKENEELSRRVAGLQRENDDLNGRLRDVQANFALFQQHQALEAEEDEKAEQPTQPEDLEFQTVSDALAAAEKEFGKDLIVYDSAKQSARRSQFARPGQVYQAIEAIADVAGIYFAAIAEGESMGPWEEAFSKRGFNDYSPGESKQTMDMYGAQRRFTHDGRKREFQKHLTLGGGDRTNCIQIYFDVNEQHKKFEVAYCGPHLDHRKQRT